MEYIESLLASEMSEGYGRLELINPEQNIFPYDSSKEKGIPGSSLVEKLMDTKDILLYNGRQEMCDEYFRNLRDELLEAGYDDIDIILEENLGFEIDD